MNKEWQDFAPAFGVAANALPRAGCAFDNGIDRLEMARVCGKTDFHFGAGRKFSDGAITEMVFHVAVAGYELGNVIVAEFGKDDAERFLQKISQNVEPAAMGHAHANFFDSRG